MSARCPAVLSFDCPVDFVAASVALPRTTSCMTGMAREAVQSHSHVRADINMCHGMAVAWLWHGCGRLCSSLCMHSQLSYMRAVTIWASIPCLVVLLSSIQFASVITGLLQNVLDFMHVLGVVIYSCSVDCSLLA